MESKFHAPVGIEAQLISQSINSEKALLLDLFTSFMSSFRQILQELTDLKVCYQDQFGEAVWLKQACERSPFLSIHIHIQVHFQNYIQVHIHIQVFSFKFKFTFTFKFLNYFSNSNYKNLKVV